MAEAQAGRGGSATADRAEESVSIDEAGRGATAARRTADQKAGGGVEEAGDAGGVREEAEEYEEEEAGGGVEEEEGGGGIEEAEGGRGAEEEARGGVEEAEGRGGETEEAEGGGRRGERRRREEGGRCGEAGGREEEETIGSGIEGRGGKEEFGETSKGEGSGEGRSRGNSTEEIEKWRGWETSGIGAAINNGDQRSGSRRINCTKRRGEIRWAAGGRKTKAGRVVETAKRRGATKNSRRKEDAITAGGIESSLDVAAGSNVEDAGGSVATTDRGKKIRGSMGEQTIPAIAIAHRGSKTWGREEVGAKTDIGTKKREKEEGGKSGD